MGENILGFFLMTLFSPYGNEDVTKLLQQAVEDDECDPKIIERLANDLGLDTDIVKKTVDNVRENYKNLKYNETKIQFNKYKRTF